MKSFVSAVQRPILGLLVFFGIFFTSTAFAEGCTPIAFLPTSITAPGTYCLTGDLTSQGGVAIDVKVDDVILDFKGYGLTGPAAYGIESRYVSNVIIRNGRITNVDTGVRIGPNSIVENMVIHRVRSGIVVSGVNSVVKNNVITDVSANNPDSTAAGIWLTACDPMAAKGVQVADNSILGFKNAYNGNGSGYGIYVGGCNSFISNNTMYGVAMSGRGKNAGIYMVNGGNNMVIGNRFSGSDGLALSCWNQDSTPRFKDNISTHPYGGSYVCHASGDLGGNF